VSSKGIVVGLTLTLVAPLAAQQPAPAPAPQSASEGVDQQTRYQIHVYEESLRQAVFHAGQQLAERASQIVPGVLLAVATDPQIRFVPTPEGPVFDVQIPPLLNAGPMALQMMMQQQQRSQPTSPAMPVAQTPDRVTGTGGIVTADPMKGPAGGAVFDPNQEYTAFAREALIVALIDNSAAVPLKEGQRLEIAASGFDVARGALYPDNSRKLMLVISFEDLTEFRQGKITKEQVKARIKEDRY
jgi:hypothetical protein